MTDELTPLESEESNLAATDNYSSQLAEAEQLIDFNEDVAEEVIDLAELDKTALLKKAEELLHVAEVKKANQLLTKIRDAFDTLLQAERPTQIREWTEAGNDPREFKPPTDSQRNELISIMHRFKEKRDDERRRAEEEKVINLKKKEDVLNGMKLLAEGEETENSLKQMRDLMRQWKEIRQIPKELRDDLYERYRFYLDKFYDNLSKFNELKDLDKEKNLEIKIELIKKVESLKEESNIRKALVTLNKFHEDWRNAGPVRREISEEIWSRFKSASDLVISDKKALQEVADKLREENLRLKELLVEKSESAVALLPTQMKEWSKIAKELDSLQEEWKKIGPVPSQYNQSIWTRFSAARQVFYHARRDFYKNINAGREENLKKKEELCAKAEKLQESSEFNQTIDALTKLQEEWKTIGPVPDAKNDAVWKRFRAAFDHFYARKNAWSSQKRAEEAGAVKAKSAIIAELEALRENEDGQAVFALLKDAQGRWLKAGFVSGKTHYSLTKKYQEVSDFLFKKFKRSSDDLKENVMKEHYSTLSVAPDGKMKLQFEERRIRERIANAQKELSTMENNMSFFANSKNAGSVLQQFEANIKKAQEQIARLEKELKVLRSMKPDNA